MNLTLQSILLVEEIKRLRRREPARLHPADMELILDRIEKVMSDALNRLNTAVVRIVTDVATDLRNHPAAQSDDGALNDAAAKLEAAATDLENANKPADTGGQATS